MRDDATRRSLLGAVGSGAIALSAGCTDVLDDANGDDGDGNGTGNESENGDIDGDADDVPDLDGGAVVFVYDDGPMEDYTQAFPVHEEFDAPASTGIVTEWVGEENHSALEESDAMSVAEIEELADAGWEIMSHTTSHAALAEFELVEDVEPEDTRIYPEENHHGFHLRYELEITDGETTVRDQPYDSGTDGDGYYLEFTEPIGESFAAGETVERYPEETMHQFLGDSKDQLEEWGFEVDTLLAPYDQVDDWAIQVAEEYYEGIANVTPTSMINDPEGFDPFDTHRDYFIEYTNPSAVELELEEIAAQEAIGILGAHTFKDEVTEDGIREVLEMVEERDLEVVTFRDAIRATADGS